MAVRVERCDAPRCIPARSDLSDRLGEVEGIQDLEAELKLLADFRSAILADPMYLVDMVNGEPDRRMRELPRGRPRGSSAPAIPPRAWTEADDAAVVSLTAEGLTRRQVAVKLGRTEGSVIQRAFILRKKGLLKAAIPAQKAV